MRGEEKCSGRREEVPHMQACTEEAGGWRAIGGGRRERR